jgi:hypothetical protein
MDTATARAILEDRLQPSVKPLLTTAEVDRLLLLARSADPYGYTPYDIWAASTLYVVSSYRIPVVNNGYYYVVTTGGVSGTNEPTWPTTSGQTVVDGGVTWQNRGAYVWTPTYGKLNYAIAEGWRMKAAKVITEVDASLGGGVSFTDSQQYEHCMRMARMYGGGIGSISLERDYVS